MITITTTVAELIEFRDQGKISCDEFTILLGVPAHTHQEDQIQVGDAVQQKTHVPAQPAN